MRLAALAGIEVFVTGGLGGVHRGAAETFDVSADLTELGDDAGDRGQRRGEEHPRHRPDPRDARDQRGAGAGARLRRVPVVLLAHSGSPRPRAWTRPRRWPRSWPPWASGLDGGIVVAHPIPEDEIPAAEIGAVIDQALADLDALGIGGKDVTPYLLGPDRRAHRRRQPGRQHRAVANSAARLRRPGGAGSAGGAAHRRSAVLTRRTPAPRVGQTRRRRPRLGQGGPMHFIGIDLAWGRAAHRAGRARRRRAAAARRAVRTDEEIEAELAAYVAGDCLVGIDAPAGGEERDRVAAGREGAQQGLPRFDAGTHPSNTGKPEFADGTRARGWPSGSGSTSTRARAARAGRSRSTRTPATVVLFGLEQDPALQEQAGPRPRAAALRAAAR